MTEQNLSEFARLLSLLGELLDREVTTTQIEAYFRILKEFSIEQVTDGVERAIATKKFFPKPSELRELIEGNPEDRAALAWAAFLEASANGGTASVKFSDRATAAAMDAVFGSWLEACRLLSAGGTDENTGRQISGCTDEMLASYQKSFLKQYAAALNSNREVSLYRAGLSELSMREQGAAWAARIPILEQPVLFVGSHRTIEVPLKFDVARGQLTAGSRDVLEGGYDAAHALIEDSHRRLQQGPQRNALPPAGEEMATPQEVAELKNDILRLVPHSSR